MRTQTTLTHEEREFFSMVNQAIFANPFSDERAKIDLKISGLSHDVSQEELISKAVSNVKNTIKHLEKTGRANIKLFSGEGRTLMENVFLFDIFYQFLEEFDKLILDQIKTGDNPIKVPFAGEALALLGKRGFSTAEACRFFAMCYQLRRAFFFINTNLIGRSLSMKELRRNLWNNVFTYNLGLYGRYLWNRMEDFSTLILGETGTGKGTAAMAIGRSGFIPFDEKTNSFAESFTKSFVSLNISQFPESLIESELFGHKKGAFTGAVEDHKGIFHRCSPYGAILLDEIGEISIPIQIKLLQILQERIFCPVGSHKKGRFEGRVIAATNRSLNEIRGPKGFRDDFFYRLCSDIIIVPPLRQRIREDPGELDDLLAHTIERMVGERSTELTRIVRQVINTQLGRGYPWYGNVRELEQCVRRVLLKHNYEGDHSSTASDLGSRLREGITKGDMKAQGLLAGYCYLLYKRYGTFEEVARRTNLDRRTVKKYILEWEDMEQEQKP